MTDTEERLQKLNDTRAMLDWLEAHPTVPLPTEFDFTITSLDSKEEAMALIREFGSCEKSWADNLFRVVRRFGTVKVKAIFWREQICERVVVGTEIVPERIEPAHTRPLIEWKCTGGLLAESTQ